MDQIALLGFLLGILVYRLSLVLWRVVSDRCFKIYSCLSTGDKLEWQGKCPSTIHAVALTAAVAYLFLAPDSPFDEAKGWLGPYVLRTSGTSTAALGFSAGYFATDLTMLVLHYPHFGDTLVAAHHVAALASVAASALTGQGHAFTLLLLGTEATTPFVNLRWTLDKARLRSHPAYLINGITMAVSWLIVRILLLGLYFFPLSRRHAAEGHLLYPPCWMLLQGVPPLLFAMNLFWFGKIARGALSLLEKSPHARVKVA